VQENEIMTDLLRRAEAIGTDRDSGASELLSRLLPLLADALEHAPQSVVAIVRCVCRGQPVMAPLWHACAAALRDVERPGTFAQLRLARERAPAALTRVAAGHLLDQLSTIERPRILTVSFSGGVLGALRAVGRSRALQVVCGEGRPRHEGRRLAESLSASGVDVILTTDAALSSYISDAAAVVVGADTIAGLFWINKVGTRALATTAESCGVQVFVVAASDKACPNILATRWQLPLGDPSEVWPGAPTSVNVENRYFERVPNELATGFLTEVGRLAPADVPALAERGAAGISLVLKALQEG
jgi:translation initiation factor 2B subunit (eIF-2B alpha/beta/delta family)